MSLSILLIIAYSGIFGGNDNIVVTSGFGDFRPRNPARNIRKYHYHHGIDLWMTEIKHKPVYYPDDDKSRNNYKPKVVYVRHAHRQTYDLIIGRFDFIHLATVGKQKKMRIGNKVQWIDTTIPISLLDSLNINSIKRLNVRRSWLALWNYCKDHVDETNNTCIWTGGLQVGIIAKDHLHLTELLIPNKPISSNLLINPLWKFRGMIVKNTMGVYSDENLNKSDGLVVVHYEA